MDWYKTVFELIDLRSFSNLWYWIALAVLWSTTSHWVLGVPFDMVGRARRAGGETAEDLHALVGINARRLLFIARVSGLWLIGLMAFFFTMLIVLGFVYWVEFAQAVFLLLAPMVIVGALSLSTAQEITLQELEGEALYRRLGRHRMTVQAIGMVSIFITSLWGMWQNMQVFNLWPD
ncbi:component of SufBCD complex [Pseudorhodobacter sp. E13]|uniref:component of SufBCD complex n=1 Tax=Pseudorhodobacter sp. E13 TaxID=2487931 RepID=UPI000F8C4FF3|nr:component of SufBCD complex [Pseudorhodobacter sp. E13]RUS60505.1 component of SufBCD complex [Pseudorhodobacter sp. E13]